MNNKEIKRKVLDFEKARQLEETFVIAQNKIEEDLKKIGMVKKILFQDVTKFIENLLEGKVLEGRKITFATTDYSKQWWIYTFNPKSDNVIGVVLGERTDSGPRFHVLFCNLDNKKVIYNDRGLV